MPICPFCQKNESESKTTICDPCRKDLDRRKGVPPTPEKLAEVRAGLMELQDMRKFPNEKMLDRVVQVVANFADIEPRWAHKLGGIVIPFQYMLTQIVATCEFFPAAVRMREIYETHFVGLDSARHEEFKKRLDE